jgi:hypothetical protein
MAHIKRMHKIQDEGSEQGIILRGIGNCLGASSLKGPGQQFHNVTIFFISTQRHKRGYQKSAQVKKCKRKLSNCPI